MCKIDQQAPALSPPNHTHMHRHTHMHACATERESKDELERKLQAIMTGVCLESKNKLERIGGLGGFSSVVMILELWMLL